MVECWTIQKEQGQGGWAFEGFISDFKAIGQRSLEIQLFHSDDSLTQRLASAYFAVYPPEALRLSSRRFGDHPVGSGPYFLSAWIPGHEAVFLKTPQWRGQKQNGQAVAEIEKIRFTSIREGSTRTLLFQNGKLDRLSPGQDAFHTFLIFLVTFLVRPSLSTRIIILPEDNFSQKGSNPLCVLIDIIYN